MLAKHARRCTPTVREPRGSLADTEGGEPIQGHGDPRQSRVSEPQTPLCAQARNVPAP
jgi:hypothetical protein